MDGLDEIRIVALRIDRAHFVDRYPDPVLVLWQTVDGDQQFANPGELVAAPRVGNTLVHVPRVTATERVRDSIRPGRSPLPKERYAAVRAAVRDAPLRLGRDREVELRLNDFTVSAVHALIWVVPGTQRAWAEDAESRNGTVHNGVVLVPGVRSELVSGDELVIGRYALLFLSPADFHRYLTGTL